MERVKRVVFTVSNDLNYDQRMQRICSTLSEAGYDVTLVGRKRQSSDALVEQLYKQVRLNLWFEKGKLFYIELNVRLFYYLLAKPFDVVCGIDLDTIMPCWFASKLKLKTCVYDAHELFTEVPEVIDRPAVRRTWLWVERFVVKRINFFYTVSESVALEFERRYGLKPAVIRNLPLIKSGNHGGNGGEMQGGARSADEASVFLRETSVSSVVSAFETRTIIYRGAVNTGRGVEQSIEAMQSIVNAKLLIAGDGDILNEAKQLTRKLNLTDKVEFTGYASPSRLNELTQQSWLGLNLLNGESLNYKYSLANKFFDYIQCGVPQITMRFPEYERVNDEYNVAILIDELSPRAIVDAVNGLVENPELYRELKLNCTKAAADLCWENERMKLLDFYRTLP